MDIYEYIRPIGQGNAGQVFLAKNKTENKNYAIKKMNFEGISEKDQKSIENEVKIMKELKHPNIVSYKDSFLDKNNYYNLVMTYCDGGDMYSKIKSQKNKHFSEQEILDWIVQVCLALSYVHDKKILHRDFKTQNVFLVGQNKYCIGDFGIAKIYNQTKDLSGAMIGTPLYMSPELYNGKKYGYKSDIWSLGCCVFELCNLKHAFEGNSWNAVAIKVLHGQRAQLCNLYSNELKQLVDQMLHLNPNNRPTIASILEKKFIKPSVAKYISEFITNPDNDDVQKDILKEQADKFGIFQTRIPNGISDNQNSEQIELNKYQKDKDALEQINDYENKLLLEKKKNIEKKIKELESQKQLLLEQLKNRNNKMKYLSLKSSLSKEKEKSKFIIAKSKEKNKSKDGMNSLSPKHKERKGSEDVNEKDINNKIYKKSINDDNLYINKDDIKMQIYERNKVTKVIQELGRMKKLLEKTNLEINGIESNEDNNKDVNDNKDLLEEDIKSDYNLNAVNIIQQRIEYFKSRCLECLGTKMFNKAYEYLKDYKRNNPNLIYNGTNNNELSIIREHLINIFGKNNIGYWQLIDQILVLEEIQKLNNKK